jgi:hypothetical protein
MVSTRRRDWRRQLDWMGSMHGSRGNQQRRINLEGSPTVTCSVRTGRLKHCAGGRAAQGGMLVHSARSITSALARVEPTGSIFRPDEDGGVV